MACHIYFYYIFQIVMGFQGWSREFLRFFSHYIFKFTALKDIFNL